ncbi:MAG: hypothetical protein PVJ49_01540 [Acidobacteriota bacterium]|jgi:hypothetical protein
MKSPHRISLYTLFALCWALMAMALLSGCLTQSISPLYDARTVVFEQRLQGSWAGDDASWSFSPDGTGGYRSLYTENGESIPATAHLARIDGRLYLDVYVDEMPEGAAEIYQWLFMPLHTLFRVDDLGDALHTSSLDYAWLEDYLEDHPDEIDYTVVDDRVVFTSGTAALQAFVAAHADDPEAWEEAIVMERRPTDRR